MQLSDFAGIIQPAEKPSPEKIRSLSTPQNPIQLQIQKVITSSDSSPFTHPQTDKKSQIEPQYFYIEFHPEFYNQ